MNHYERLSKTLKLVEIFSKIFEKYFQMDNIIDRSGDTKSFFAADCCYTIKTSKIKSMVLVCSIPWLCIVKNYQKMAMFMRSGM